MVAIAGPGGVLQSTASRDNSVYRGVLLFFSLAESDSGMYSCQVMVDGTIASEIAIAAMDVTGMYTHGIGAGKGKVIICGNHIM